MTEREKIKKAIDNLDMNQDGMFDQIFSGTFIKARNEEGFYLRILYGMERICDTDAVSLEEVHSLSTYALDLIEGKLNA